MPRNQRPRIGPKCRQCLQMFQEVPYQSASIEVKTWGCGPFRPAACGKNWRQVQKKGEGEPCIPWRPLLIRLAYRENSF